MGRVRSGTVFLTAGLMLLTPVAVQAGTESAMSGAYSARDVRMETRTHWDYQPGQGPARKAQDRDYFRPVAKNLEAPVPPPPPVQPGDWRDPPTAESMIPPKSPSFQPKTESSIEVGVQLSNYHYHEPDFMRIQGPTYGFSAAVTSTFGAHWFARAAGRFAGGNPEYKGSGLKRDTPNYMADLRATIGRDFLWGRFGVSPYVGIGYRFLQSDLRRVTSPTVSGYNRDSQYLFAPIGVQPRLKFSNGARLTLTAEFDPLLQGWQDSQLSDISAAWPDIRNTQKSGYGLHGAMNYETRRWSVGPFVDYWNISQSTTDCAAGTGAGALFVCGYEPHNHTLEYGLSLRYRFFYD